VPACASHLGFILRARQAESSDQLAGNRKQLLAVVALVPNFVASSKMFMLLSHLLFLLAF
jgi:hypothetical protein